MLIKIPESIWVAIQNGEYCGILDDRTYNAIKNGIQLEDVKDEIERKCCITVGRENDPAITLYDVFHIIDKYKAESEGQNENCNTCIHHKPDNPYCECCFDLNKFEPQESEASDGT